MNCTYFKTRNVALNIRLRSIERFGYYDADGFGDCACAIEPILKDFSILDSREFV